MIQPSEALNVWHYSDGQSEFIVAAKGTTRAVEAFDRVKACRGQQPQRYPEVESNFAGRSLAITSPGKIYRRKLAAPTVK